MAAEKSATPGRPMNAPRPARSNTPCFALALAVALAAPIMAGTPGCIGKRRPRADEQAAATAATVGARIIQPEDVDGKHDALVEGKRLRVKIDEQDPATGAALPLVTIVEFSDFQCPYCSRLADSLDEVVEEYGQDVKLVFKQFPLPMHPQAEPAARAVLAAHQQGKFWPLHDKLFQNQRALSNADLEAYARGAGLDIERWRKDFESDALRQHVREELDFGRALGVSSTPTFYVNGRFFKGAQSPDDVRVIIEEELAAARKLLAAGVEREELYARFLHAAPALPGAEAKPAEAEPPKLAKPTQPGVPADAEPDPDHVAGEASRTPNYAVPTGKDRPSKGPADALVTIVEFGALDCDACRSVQPAVQRLLAKHPADVRLVYRHLAETPAAKRSAQIAGAAHRQGKFWEAHDRLLKATGDLTPEMAEQLAKDLGLDTTKFMHDLRDRGEGGPLRMLQEDLAVVDVFRGTAPAPIFFVNGRYLDGTASFEDFDRLVQEEKTKAQAFLAEKNVVDKTQLYDSMIRTWRGYEQAQNPPTAGAKAPLAEAPPPAGGQ
jgi:protein-disulfide isomerase